MFEFNSGNNKIAISAANIQVGENKAHLEADISFLSTYYHWIGILY